MRERWGKVRGVGLVALAALAAGATDAAARQDGDAVRLAQAFERGDFGTAWDLAGELSDPVARADWRSYLLHASGDLPGELAACREGLRASPCHPTLLARAVPCALTLGLAEVALELVERLESCARSEGFSPETREDLERRAREARPRAEELAARQRRARQSLVLAKGVVVAAAAAVAALLAFLFLRTGARGS